MLLKKKIFLFIIVLLLLAPTISPSQACEVSRVKNIVKKTLHLYFTQKNISVTKNQIKDMLAFYLSINSQNLTADCSAYGISTNQQIIDIINFAENLPDRVPSCADGTKYGECSNNKPGYCFAGKFYNKCQICGCPSYSRCGSTGACIKESRNITCFSNLDCGKSEFVGNYYCSNSYITKNYINYTCTNPGTTNAKCVSTNGSLYLTYCDTNLNQACVAGQSTCQSAVSNVTNQTNQTQPITAINIKGRLIDYFSKNPIANAAVFTWDGQTQRLVYSNSNGEFSISADAKNITITSPKSFGINPSCYDNMGFAVFRNADNSMYVNVQINRLIGSAQQYAISGADVNLGGIQLWPAVTINIYSDIAVQFVIRYGGLDGSGNVGYKTYHTLSYSFPLNVDAGVKLTDSSGIIYHSPNINLPLSNGCTPVTLNFSNEQFNWVGVTQINQTNLTQPTGVCLIRDSYTSVPLYSAPDVGKGYAKKAIPGVNTLTGLQSACTNAIYYNITQSYCTKNSNSVQEQVVTYDGLGNAQSLTCGAFGCNYRNCSSITNQTQDWCVDSDNGINTYTKGFATGMQKGIFVNLSDYCAGSTNYVYDAYCGTNITYQIVACNYKCLDGACVNQTITLVPQCKVIDFENPPHLSFHLTWNPDLGVQDSYNYNLDETARQWLKAKGMNITGTPNGIVWGTRMSGAVGTTGVVIGFASPNFIDYGGLSDNEQLLFYFLNNSPKNVQFSLTSVPSNVDLVNNVVSTIVTDAFDSAGNLVGTSTKTFTGVTNGAYTPTKINVTSSAANIAKIALKATQHPYDGVYIEDVTSCT